MKILSYCCLQIKNRPVRWEQDDTVVTMDFDRMGRRVFYKEEVNGAVTKHHRFVYDNYLCVQKVDALNNNAQINLFVWNPTEPVATRPLFTTDNPFRFPSPGGLGRIFSSEHLDLSL